ncbi:MAG: LysE family translocator [Candidatus Velamenicoccus archaeovorus]
MNDLLGLLLFAFAGSVSPGPNNAVLWASGLRFGFRRTVPHVLGTAIGIGALVMGVALGIGALLERFPALEVILKVVGSVYLLVIAFLVAGSGAVGRTSVSRPLSVWQGVLFQCVNPKAWVFAVAAAGTFLPSGIHRPVGLAAVAGVLMLVVVGSSSIWAMGGAALASVIEDEHRRRLLNGVVALLLVASVALLWI